VGSPPIPACNGSTIIVPPAPLPLSAKLAAEYWPSRSSDALWTPSLTVSVPLVLLDAAT
jgi:hypothetical protein